MIKILDKAAAKEALTDAGIGFFLAFPAALAVLSATTWLGFGVITTAVLQTLVFTIVSLGRTCFVKVQLEWTNDGGG